MRIALLGCGSIGRRHALNLKALGIEVIPVDVFHQAAARLTADLGESGFTVGELRNFDNVDAILICTPASTHGRLARRLLANGYQGPLFVEKPLALSSEDAEIFRHWPSPVTMVGYNLRFHWQALDMRRLIAPIDSITCRLDCDMRTWPGHGYGPPLLECSHELDLALWCGASPQVSIASISEDEIEISLGQNGQVTVKPCAAVYFRQWHARGKEYLLGRWPIGFIECDFRFSSADELGGQMYRDELQHFIEAVRERRETACPFEDGLQVLDVCEQAQRLAGVIA